MNLSIASYLTYEAISLRKSHTWEKVGLQFSAKTINVKKETVLHLNNLEGVVNFKSTYQTVVELSQWIKWWRHAVGKGVQVHCNVCTQTWWTCSTRYYHNCYCTRTPTILWTSKQPVCYWRTLVHTNALCVSTCASSPRHKQQRVAVLQALTPVRPTWPALRTNRQPMVTCCIVSRVPSRRSPTHARQNYRVSLAATRSAWALTAMKCRARESGWMLVAMRKIRMWASWANLVSLTTMAIVASRRLRSTCELSAIVVRPACTPPCMIDSLRWE